MDEGEAHDGFSDESNSTKVRPLMVSVMSSTAQYNCSSDSDPILRIGF